MLTILEWSERMGFLANGEEQCGEIKKTYLTREVDTVLHRRAHELIRWYEIPSNEQIEILNIIRQQTATASNGNRGICDICIM